MWPKKALSSQGGSSEATTVVHRFVEGCRHRPTPKSGSPTGSPLASANCVGMSRKRPLTELSDTPPESQEELPEMLVNILNDMGTSQQLLSVHSHSLAECMRIVNHLHTVLAQAHQSTSERIERTVQANPELHDLQ